MLVVRKDFNNYGEKYTAENVVKEPKRYHH
jgi:hypothetical protein